MRKPKPITIDFETYGIEKRPFYPPKPVGVSIKLPGKKSKYYAWGHPEGNNCSFEEAKAALEAVWDNTDGLLFQNAKFDVDVAEVHMGLPIPNWDRIHDTMYLLFLNDPHQQNFGLKESAEILLDLPPEERDAVGEWLITNQHIEGVKISSSKKSEHFYGKYIAYAPGGLVGKYANGDVERTEKLFNLLYQRIAEQGMLCAYNRERKLMPILLENERRGIRINIKKLKHDVEVYNDALKKVDEYILKKLNAQINIDSPDQLMKALIDANLVDVEKIPLTPTGKYQANKASISASILDSQLGALLVYRAGLTTCLGTFMEPWLETAKNTGGYIHTLWNQIKSPKDGTSVGTTTGRLSSTPNFQNIPKQFSKLFKTDKKEDLPTCPIKNLPDLPSVREYVIPSADGHVLLDRDYSQQEPRILAHFDGGDLMDTYNKNPWTDFHDYAKAELEKLGKFYDRKPVKNTNLGLIYGMGTATLAEKNNMSMQEAGELKKAILSLYPGLSEMYADMKVRARNNEPIRTWGGRLYYCEKPKIVNGRMREFDYKMVNCLIQGSAADCTKEAIIRFDEYRKQYPNGENWLLVVNIHDEIIISAPKEDAVLAMDVLRMAMESIEFDVPMLSEGKMSDVSWQDLKDYDKKGEIVYGK